MDNKPKGWQDIVKMAENSNVTLLYGARETQYNNATALKQYLDKQLEQRSSL